MVRDLMPTTSLRGTMSLSMLVPIALSLGQSGCGNERSRPGEDSQSNQSALPDFQLGSKGETPVQWTAVVNSCDYSAAEMAQGVAVDRDRNVYIAGPCPSIESELIKLSPNGAKLWHKTVPGLASLRSMTIDSDQRLVVVGESARYGGGTKPPYEGQSSDGLVIKFDTDGSVNSTWHYSIPGTYQTITEVEPGVDGSIYTAVIGKPTNGRTYTTRIIRWLRDGSIAAESAPHQPTYYGAGCSVAAGNDSVATNCPGYLTKLDPRTLAEVWHTSEIIQNYPATFYNIKILAEGDIALLLHSYVVFSGEGTEVSTAKLGDDNDPTHHYSAHNFTVDARQNIYVTGAFWRDNGGADLWTAKFTNQGTLVWQDIMGHTGKYRDGGIAIAIDDTSVYVAGTTYTRNLDKIALKYRQ